MLRTSICGLLAAAPAIVPLLVADSPPSTRAAAGMVWIPAGEFMMGRDLPGTRRNQQRVGLRSDVAHRQTRQGVGQSEDQRLDRGEHEGRLGRFFRQALTPDLQK